MVIIVRNFMADKIAFGSGVLGHHPEEPLLEVWELTNIDQVTLGIRKVLGGWLSMGRPFLSSSTYSV